MGGGIMAVWIPFFTAWRKRRAAEEAARREEQRAAQRRSDEMRRLSMERQAGKR